MKLKTAIYAVLTIILISYCAVLAAYTTAPVYPLTPIQTTSLTSTITQTPTQPATATLQYASAKPTSTVTPTTTTQSSTSTKTPSSNPTINPSHTPAPTPTPTAKTSPTSTPIHSPTPTTTLTPTPNPTPSPTPSPTPTATPTPTSVIGTIFGHVTVNGQPQGGVTLFGGLSTATTDGSGYYEMSAAKNVQVKITALYNNYSAASGMFTMDADRKQVDLNIEMPVTSNPNTLPCLITGTVTVNGVPTTGVTVSAPGAHQSYTTGSDGLYYISVPGNGQMTQVTATYNGISVTSDPFQATASSYKLDIPITYVVDTPTPTPTPTATPLPTPKPTLTPTPTIKPNPTYTNDPATLDPNKYYAGAYGTKFHRYDCQYVSYDILPWNLIIFNTREEADVNYDPCTVCNP